MPRFPICSATALAAALLAAPALPAAAHHGGSHTGLTPLVIAAADAEVEVINTYGNGAAGEAEGVDKAAGYGDAKGAKDGEYAERGLMDVNYIFWEAVWSILAFVIFALIAGTVVWPKVLTALQARENKQRADLKAAENAARKAEASLADYNAKLAEARAEASGIIDESRVAAQQVAAGVRGDMERETAQMRERASKEIAAAKQAALADIYEQAAELSTEIAGKILGREISADDQQALVTQTIQQMDADPSRT